MEGLGGRWPCNARAQEGQAVKYGIRPEHLALAASGIPAEIEVVEPMGAETEILARAGGQTFNLMMHGRASHAPGERVFLAADAAQPTSSTPQPVAVSNTHPNSGSGCEFAPR